MNSNSEYFTDYDIIEILSPRWWEVNLISINVIVFILIIGYLLKGNKQNFILAYILAGIFSIDILANHTYQLQLSIWDVQKSVPLHFCGISYILSVIFLLKPNQYIFELIIYWGIPGAIHAFLTPQFEFGTTGYLFWRFYLSHGGLLLTALYGFSILNYRPRVMSWWRIFLHTQFLLLGVALFNYIFKSNYMFLCEPPLANNPFVIGTWPWYFIILEFVALIHLIIVYFLFKKKDKQLSYSQIKKVSNN